MRRRSRAILVAAFLFAGGFAVLRWFLPVVEHRAQGRLERALSRRLGWPARIARVEIHPFLAAVTLHDVRLGPSPDDPLFFCENWRLQARPFRLRSRFPWLIPSLGASRVQKPAIHVPPDGKGFAPVLPPWLSHKVEWTEGSLRLPARGQRPGLVLERVSGSLRVLSGRLRLEAEGQSALGPFETSAEADESGLGRATVFLKAVPLKDVAARWSSAKGSWEGGLSLRLRVEGTLWPGAVPPEAPPLRWETSGTLREASWSPDDARAEGSLVVPMRGAFELGPDELRLKDFYFFEKLRVEGKCLEPFQKENRRLDLALSARQVSLEEWRRSLPEKVWPVNIPLEGKADVEGRISGPPAAPDIRLNAAVQEPRVAAVRIPSLEASLVKGPESLRAEISLLNGKVVFERAEGHGADQKPFVDAQVERLDLSELSRANHWGDIDGLLSGRFRMRDPRSQREPLAPTDEPGARPRGKKKSAEARPPLAEGSFQVDRFAWGGHRETQPIAAHFAYGDGEFTAQSRKNAFHVKARRLPDKIVLSDCALELPSGISLSAQGTVEGPDRRLSLKTSFRRVPLEELPFLLERYPEAGGTLDFEGDLAGTWAEPSFSGTARIMNLRLREKGQTAPVRASLRWDRRGFILSDLDLDGDWKGRAAWSSQGGWSLELSVEKGDMAWLADLLKSPARPQGDISGEVRLASPAKGLESLEGTGRFSCSPGQWGALAYQDVRASFRVERGTLHLESWDLRQSSGSWHMDGRLPLGGPSAAWSCVSQFKHLSFSALTLDGEVRLQRTAPDRPPRFHSPNFWVNGYGVGAVEGELSLAKDRWGIDGLRAGDLLSGQLTFSPRQGVLKGRGTVKNMRLAEWGDRLGAVHPLLRTGVLNASLSLEGPWRSPRSRVEAKWRDAEWNGLVFDASFQADWAASQIRLRTLEARLRDGGQIQGSGTVSLAPATGEKAAPEGPPVPPSLLDVSLTLKAVPLDRCLRAMGWRAAPWLGPLDGDLKWTGTWSDPRVAGSLWGGKIRVGNLFVTGWNGKVRYQSREFHLDEFYATTPEGVWRLKEGSRAFLTGAGEGHLQLINELRNIHLGPLNLFGGLEIVGRWKNEPAPSFECTLRAQSLWVNQHLFEQDLARVVWSQKKILFSPVPQALQELSGAVHLDRLPQVRLENLTLKEGGKRRFWMQGEAGPDKWDFEFGGWDLEAATLMSLADFDLPVEGRLNARVQGRGSPAKPRVRGEVWGRNGKLARLPYDRFHAAVLWEGDVLEVKDLEAARRNGYVLSGEGRFPTDVQEEDPADKLSFVLRLSNGDLGILKSLWPDCESAAGGFRGELRFLPGEDGVETSGFLVVENGRVKARRYFRDLSDLNARLLIKDNRLLVEDLSGRFGQGRLVAGGSLGVNGFDITDYDLSVESVGSQGIEIEIPQLAVPPGPLLKRFSLLRASLEDISRGEPRVYLKVTGPDGRQTVQGTVFLEDTQFTYPPSKKGFSGVREDSWVREFWREAAWDVVLKTGDDTWYRNEYVNVQLRGSLHLEGPREAMRASGRLETKRGVITYLGQSFNVKRCLFEVVTDTRTYAGERAVVPYLSGEAERVAPIVDARGFATPDTILMIVDRAPLGEIQPRFISRNNPGLSSEQVAQRALGLSGEQFTPEEKDKLLRAGLVQLLGSTAGPLANRLAHRFGIDILYPIYEPTEEASAEPAVPTAAPRRDVVNLLQGTGATAGVQLSDRIFGVYKFKVDQTQNQLFFRDEVELTYRVRGNLHLKASTELDTEKLLGQPPDRRAVLENQWRFGLPKPPADAAREPLPEKPAKTP